MLARDCLLCALLVAMTAALLFFSRLRVSRKCSRAIARSFAFLSWLTNRCPELTNRCPERTRERSGQVELEPNACREKWTHFDFRAPRRSSRDVRPMRAPCRPSADMKAMWGGRGCACSKAVPGAEGAAEAAAAVAVPGAERAKTLLRAELGMAILSIVMVACNLWVSDVQEGSLRMDPGRPSRRSASEARYCEQRDQRDSSAPRVWPVPPLQAGSIQYPSHQVRRDETKQSVQCHGQIRFAAEKQTREQRPACPHVRNSRRRGAPGPAPKQCWSSCSGVARSRRAETLLEATGGFRRTREPADVGRVTTADELAFSRC